VDIGGNVGLYRWLRTRATAELPKFGQAVEWYGKLQTRHQRSPSGLNHRPVQDGASLQCVACIAAGHRSSRSTSFIGTQLCFQEC
jgi:hypothetical protein